MAISFFFLKYFHNMPNNNPPKPKRESSGFQSIGDNSATANTSKV
jgi:hypothetical protein